MDQLMDMEFYSRIREILASARAKAYSAVNFAMVEAYWKIGKSIVKNRAEMRPRSTAPAF